MRDQDNTRTTGLFFQLKWAMLFSILLLGCDSGNSGWDRPKPADANIEGVLLLNGTPVGPFTIHFTSNIHGLRGTAQVGRDGKFRLEEKISSGSYAIYLSNPTEGKAPAGIPEVYYIDTSTDLRIEINPGMNTVQLNMKP